eukprot:363549-Chlamydomonas_euryale.AAC.5
MSNVRLATATASHQAPPLLHSEATAHAARCSKGVRSTGKGMGRAEVVRRHAQARRKLRCGFAASQDTHASCRCRRASPMPASNVAGAHNRLLAARGIVISAPAPFGFHTIRPRALFERRGVRGTTWFLSWLCAPCPVRRPAARSGRPPPRSTSNHRHCGPRAPQTVAMCARHRDALPTVLGPAGRRAEAAAGFSQARHIV